MQTIDRREPGVSALAAACASTRASQWRRWTIPPGVVVVAVCWAVQQLPAIPARGICWALILTGFALAPMPRVGMIAGAGFAAAGWAMLRADDGLRERLPPALEGLDITVVGVVADMPQSFDRGLRFRFQIEHCVVANDPCPGPVAVKVAWYRGFGREPNDAVASNAPGMPPEAIEPGERWQLNLRLKRPHASLNPGLFDVELRAIEEGVAATGFVRKASGERANKRIDAFVVRPGTLIERARAYLRARMTAVLAQQPAHVRGVVIALVIGDQAAIPARWWEVFNRTGIGHLMSISGLHITMLAALAAGITDRVWRSARLARAMSPRPLAAIVAAPTARWAVGLAVAFGYSALAGWGIPAQRTCWMLAAAGVALLSGRARSPVAVLATAAAVVCVLDPWAPLAAGFWLSFAAVASIIWYGSARGRRHGEHAAAKGSGDRAARVRAALIEALRAQFAATLVLLPLGVVFFASVSLVSPFANAFAIPLVSALITPLALAGASLMLLWSPAGAMLLALAAWLTDVLLVALDWVDPGGIGSLAIPMPPAPVLGLAALACAWLLAPIPLPGRAVASFALLPLVSTPPDTPAPGELRLTALDVGQGMAVLVEAGGRRLLYDTGPQFGVDNDAGARRVVVPYLRSRGIRRLDAMVVSHLDLDHSGGALAVLRNLRVDWVASSLAPEHPIVTGAPRHYPCLRGERWSWGDAHFEWLHPGTEAIVAAKSQTNARSCVLRVQTPAGVALLAGDIEAGQERRLIELFDARTLRADLLLAPHHGSATSSSAAFLDAVDPSWAIFQVGYRNRFRHPNARVLERYLARGIGILRSDSHAAITVSLRTGEAPKIARLRVDDSRYWRIRVDEIDAPRAKPVDE